MNYNGWHTIKPNQTKPNERRRHGYSWSLFIRGHLHGKIRKYVRLPGDKKWLPLLRKIHWWRIHHIHRRRGRTEQFPHQPKYDARLDQIWPWMSTHSVAVLDIFIYSDKNRRQPHNNLHCWSSHPKHLKMRLSYSQVIR